VATVATGVGGRVTVARRPGRVVIAAVLLAAALAGLLGVWFVSGWADVRARQHELATAPAHDATQLGDQVARDLRSELGRLVAREAARPYYHYGNLFHDPKAGGSSVTPSPLAGGPGDPLVLGHFQIDPAGRVTTPTINDDVPELSEPAHLAANTAFRDEVRAHLSGRLVVEQPTRVAEAAPDPRAPRTRPQVQRSQTQVIELDPSSYAQNNASNDVFWQQQAATPRPVPKPPPKPTPRPAPAPLATTPEGRIPITISAFDWRTEPYGGVPTLIAVRHVDTPDGTLVQGFVVSRASLDDWLATRAGDTALALVPDAAGDPAASRGEASDVAPGWTLSATPSATVVAASAASAGDIARTFVVRFVIVGAIAALVFGFVVVLVARAEQLARERSQFAAAAAHELRTPLAGLQLYGDMLADGLGDPGKLADYARRMSEEASRLGRVVSNVLGFSQLERGNLAIDAREGELGKLLCELADRTQPALDRAGAVLDLDVPPELRATFDHDAVTRIVGNLLDNAEKYGRDADDRTISLRAREVTNDHGDRVEVTVSDRGPGVPDKTRRRLFETFHRGSSTTDGAPAGLGLGLSLSRSLARAMGGELAYLPREGGGASFVLRLRRAA